ITPDDLDAAAELGRVTVQPGDVVLMRTGQIAMLRQPRPDKWAYVASSPGPGLAAVTWFRDHDIAAVATDTYTFEVYPWEDDAMAMAVHLLDLVDIGLLQGQNWDL